MRQPDTEIDLWVARRLRALRTERGITLNALAERVGISAPHLSRLEKGQRQPSIGALLQLARAYGLSVSQLVEERPEADYHLVRAAESAGHPGVDGEYTVLSGPRTGISVVRLALKPRRATTPVRHPGEEWLHVVSGQVGLTLDDEVLTLGAGDSVHFDSARAHHLHTDGPSTVLIVSTAPAMPTHHPIPTSGRQKRTEDQNG